MEVEKYSHRTQPFVEPDHVGPTFFLVDRFPKIAVNFVFDEVQLTIMPTWSTTHALDRKWARRRPIRAPEIGGRGRLTTG